MQDKRSCHPFSAKSFCSKWLLGVTPSAVCMPVGVTPIPIYYQQTICELRLRAARLPSITDEHLSPRLPCPFHSEDLPTVDSAAER